MCVFMLLLLLYILYLTEKYIFSNKNDVFFNENYHFLNFFSIFRYADGSAALHTRSARHGKLGPGVLVGGSGRVAVGSLERGG
jgi:hypothetical protein